MRTVFIMKNNEEILLQILKNQNLIMQSYVAVDITRSVNHERINNLFREIDNTKKLLSKISEEDSMI